MEALPFRFKPGFFYDKSSEDSEAEKIIDYVFLGIFIATTLLFLVISYRTLMVKENRTY